MPNNKVKIKKSKPGTTTDSAKIKSKHNAIKINNLEKRYKAGEKNIPDRGLVRLSENNTNILIGKEDLSSWDDDELIRGQRRNKNGKFGGKPPKVVPKALHDELVKRAMSSAMQLLNTNLVAAVTELTKIAKSSVAEDKDKLKAIELIMNRVMGKAPDKIEFTGDTPNWMQSIMVSIVAKNSEDIDIEDAEIVEE